MTDELKQQVEIIAAPWTSSHYYEDAERWTHIFWSSNSQFYNYFSKPNFQTVVELACGHGRHSELVARHAGTTYPPRRRAGQYNFLPYPSCAFQQHRVPRHHWIQLRTNQRRLRHRYFLLRCHGAFQSGRRRVLQAITKGGGE